MGFIHELECALGLKKKRTKKRRERHEGRRRSEPRKKDGEFRKRKKR